MNSLLQFLRLPWADKLATIEAIASLIAAWGIVRFVAFKTWTARLGLAGVETRVTTLSPADEQRVLRVRAAIDRGRRIARPLNNCLVRAVAARLMLRRRYLPSTLYISVITSQTGPQLGVSGHAWVRCGHVTISSNKDGMHEILCLGDPAQ